MLGKLDVLAGDAHDRERFAVGVGGEVGTDRLIRAAAIGRLQHHVGADVDRRGIERRQLHRRVPVESIHTGGVARLQLGGLGPHRGALVGPPVNAAHAAVLRFRIDNARIGRIHQRLETVTAVNHVPVVVGDAAVSAHRARPAPGVVVLQARADVIRRLHVEFDVVGLRPQHVRQPGPGARAVARNADAAVVADDDVPRIARVDPHRVMIDVDPLGAITAEAPPRIIRDMQRHAEHVDP